MLPPLHVVTRLQTRRMQDWMFSIAFVVDSVRSRASDSRSAFTVSVSSSPSLIDVAADGWSFSRARARFFSCVRARSTSFVRYACRIVRLTLSCMPSGT